MATKEDLQDLVTSQGWKSVADRMRMMEQDAVRSLLTASEMKDVLKWQSTIRAIHEVLVTPHKLIDELEIKENQHGSENEG